MTTTKKITLNKMAKIKNSILKPNKLTLRSYQVGFGDCFLLTFHYEQDLRHVLIDFGSTGRPKDAPKDLMTRVAKQIEEDCGKKLHIIVATHRHKDHIGGFETGEKKESSGNIIRSCSPDLVIMPWTEDPEAPVDAKHATSVPGKGLRPFAQSLTDMQLVAESVLRYQKRLQKDLDSKVNRQLAFLGEENLKNSSAVKNLLTMGAQPPMFVRYDDKPLDLESLLPGVTVRVLGPPDLEQSKEIKSMRSKDATQFWMLQAEATKGMDQQLEVGNIFKPGFGNSVSRSQHLFPPHTRWFIRRMNAFRGNQLLSLVRILDGVLNNTSIILLFEVGGRKLLFPGDAQIENWNYALSRPGIDKLLEDVDVYKVGHHGSRNANPISIWKGFKKKRNGNNAGNDVLRTFMSTMAGKHGGHNPKDRTEVPRESLVEALQKETVHFSTQMLKADELGQEFDIPLKH